MKTLIQIGTNTGSDDFLKLCQSQNEKCQIVLIEPNSELNSHIEHNYKIIKQLHNVVLINKAVVDVEDLKEVKLFYTPVSDGLSSLIERKSYNLNDYKVVAAATLNSILEQLGIKKIDELHIDAEGLDYTILLSLDLNKYDFRLITCEIWPYNDDDKTGNFKTGPSLIPEIFNKYKDFKISETVITGMPSLMFEKNINLQ